MTYGRVLPAIHMHILDGAVVSHLTELGGRLPSLREVRPPHPAVSPKASLRLDGHLLPKERRGRRARSEIHPWSFKHEISCLKHLAI